MLVLSRRENEGIVITLPDGTIIRVSVLLIQSSHVRLGFEAPPDVAIHREELVNEIKRPKEGA